MKIKKLNGSWYLNGKKFPTLHDALSAAFSKRQGLKLPRGALSDSQSGSCSKGSLPFGTPKINTKFWRYTE